MSEPQVKTEVDEIISNYSTDDISEIKLESQDADDYNSYESPCSMNNGGISTLGRVINNLSEDEQDNLSVDYSSKTFGKDDDPSPSPSQSENSESEEEYSDEAENLKDLIPYKIIVHQAPYKCDSCSLVFQDYIRFRDHKKEIHQDDPMVYCEVCNIPCGSKPAYKIHRTTHVVQSPECRKSDELSRKEKNSSSSQKSEIGQAYPTPSESLIDELEIYFCDICQNTFANSTDRKNHKCKDFIEQPKTITIKRSRPIKIKSKVERKPFGCPAPRCKSRFATTEQLESHKAECIYFVILEKDSQCKDCGKTFKYGLRMHLKEHCIPIKKDADTSDPNGNNEVRTESRFPVTSKYYYAKGRKLKCPEENCEVLCTSEYWLIKHKNEVHGYLIPITNPKKQCKICGWRFRFINGFKYKRHMRTKHGIGKPFNIRKNKQNVTLDSQRNRESNRRMDEGILARNFGQEFDAGDYFDQEFDAGDDFGQEFGASNNADQKCKDLNNNSIKEAKKSRPKVQYKCPWCEEIFRYQTKLFEHEKTHEDSREVACEHCGKIYNSLVGLTAHKKYCNKGPFLCTTCGKIFNSEKRLAVHEQRHRPDRPFVCELCGSSYKIRDELRMHMKRHKDETLDKELFKCKDCGKVLKNSNSLSSHRSRAHTGVQANRIISCSLCGKTTKNMSNMRIHMRVHDPNRIVKKPRNVQPELQTVQEQTHQTGQVQVYDLIKYN